MTQPDPIFITTCTPKDYEKLLPSTPAKFFTPLESLTVLRCEGADAHTFLQGQITADMQSISKTQGTLSCCLNLKGRAISSFIILNTEKDTYDLLISKDISQITLNTLKKYAVFSKVTLSLLNETSLILGIASNNPNSNLQEATTQLSIDLKGLQSPYATQVTQSNTWVRMPGLFQRYVCICHACNSSNAIEALQQHGLTPGSADLWKAHQALAGEVYIDTALSETIIPNMLDYDQLGAISFEKGCYRGQEIIARLHYRGAPKEELFLANLSWQTSKIPKAGTPITDTNDRSVGQILVTALINTQKLLCLVLLKKDAIGQTDLRLMGVEIPELHLRKISYTK